MGLGRYGHQIMTSTIASNATLTSAFNVAEYNHVAIELPTFSIGIATNTANVYVQVCNTATGTFRRVQDVGVYSGASGIYDWETPSSTGNRIVICRPAERFDYIKVELSNTATAGSNDGYPITVHVHN